MYPNGLLQITFMVSVLSHGVILLVSPNFNPFTPAPKVQEIKVRYLKEKPLDKSSPKSVSGASSQKLMPKAEPFLRLDSKLVAGVKGAPLPYIEPPDGSAGAKAIPNKSLGFSKPIFSSSEIISNKKKITLPEIKMARIDNPSYISYYQIVREKIRRSAYQNYTHNDTGEVYVSFVISNDGYIKDVRLAEDKTTAKDYLKSIALRSIKDASPFPNFPKTLDYQQLSFNIIISFEIE